MGHIYKILNSIDDRVYIGSTVNLNKRWSEHKRDLSKNRHQNIHLQNFVNKYGLNALIFEILEETNNSNLLVREQYHMDNTINKFNIALNSSAPMLNKKHTAKALIKISNSSTGSNNSMYGKKRPQWLIDKLTLCNLGRVKSNYEKIIRLINLPNRHELLLKKNGQIINCFSISHAAKIIGVSQQSVSSAIKRNSESMGWKVSINDDCFFNKKVLFKNISLFDENCHPQPELIDMLQSLNPAVFKNM